MTIRESITSPCCLRTYMHMQGGADGELGADIDEDMVLLDLHDMAGK